MPPKSPDLTWFAPESDGVQERFITTWEKESVFAGGVGAGKTLSGAFKALIAATQWPGGVGLVGRQTYRALEDTTQKVMLYGDDKPAVIPPELIADTKSSMQGNKVILTCGSEILFRSLEPHNIEKLMSLNLSWVYVDELTETTLKMWLALKTRLRHPIGPSCAWGSTNPNGHDWVWKRFHPDAGEPSGTLYIQPTEANRKHLRPDYLADLRRMPKDYQKRYVDASFDTAAGAIWDMYDRQIHVFDHDLVGGLPSNWKRFRSMDHGRRNPTCVLWWVITNDGDLIVEDEYYVEDKLPRDHAVAISAKDTMIAPHMTYGPIIAPPDCFRAGNEGTTVADEYRTAANLVLTPANDNVNAGILRVGEWLSRSHFDEFPDWHQPLGRTKGPDDRGAPRLFISDRCTNLIGELPNYEYKDLSVQLEDERDQPEEPKKIRDHACDALRYGVMSRGRPRPIVPVEPKELIRVPPAVTQGLLERQF